MSWSPFAEKIKDFTESSGVVTLDGIICGTCKNFSASQTDAVSYAQMFKDFQHAREIGCSYNDQKLFVVKLVDGNKILAQRDHHGVCLAKSNAVIIVGVFNDSHDPMTVLNEVGKVADGLVAQGY